MACRLMGGGRRPVRREARSTGDGDLKVGVARLMGDGTWYGGLARTIGEGSMDRVVVGDDADRMDETSGSSTGIITSIGCESSTFRMSVDSSGVGKGAEEGCRSCSWLLRP